MNVFVVFSIWIICVLCTIIVAPINVNLLEVFEHHFNLSAALSESKTPLSVPWEPGIASFLSWDFQLYLYLKY